MMGVEGRPGRPAIDPQIVVALWLYATIEGIGSARAVAWLCANHHGFRWLCGGVEVNINHRQDAYTAITPGLTFASRTSISWMSCSPTVWPP